MTEHTPGPWKAEKEPVGRIVCVVPHDDYPDDDWFVTTPNLRENTDVDARFIAAAPALLAALEPFAYLAEVMDEGNVLNFRGVYVTYEQAQAAADAIAKARGES